MRRWERRAAGALAIVSTLAALAACAPEPVAPTTGPTAPSASAAPTAAPEPTLVPDGSAADNLPLFTRVVADVWGSEQRGAGRAYVDALVAAGFDKAAMQVTRDVSTVGNAAESIQFSVRWGEECLIGQVGPETGDPVTSVEAAIDGVCLIGNTRPIDW
ncbi:hypothetical protein A7J15_00935 [Microbacterium sediminis]|uniref:DUF6993 domain-containing protein n=1 Tax=Microbacterium sediminis TaxID=904291 RepID=A0A1B9NGY1_9MICO|nr:hypothetical protein A7J15_00935 [Microbacterium sediminis]